MICMFYWHEEALIPKRIKISKYLPSEEGRGLPHSFSKTFLTLKTFHASRKVAKIVLGTPAIYSSLKFTDCDI